MYGHESQPDWIKKMGRGYMMDQRRKILGDADLGQRDVFLALIAALGVPRRLAVACKQDAHAYTCASESTPGMARMLWQRSR